MNILITGKGTTQAWQIRAVQLGKMLDAQIVPKASLQQIKQADLVITVKHTQPHIEHAKISVLDIIDAYPQPSKWKYDQFISWGKQYMQPYNYTMAATHKMQQDLKTDFWLRHHYRPGIVENQIKQNITTIGYEGRELYIGNYLPIIEQQCKLRGWQFIVNPTNVADCDVILAVRDESWRGYAADNWKSCVKMSNAIGSLTPLIAMNEQGYIETNLPFVAIDKPRDLIAAFDKVCDFNYRTNMVQQYVKAKPYYSLETVGKEYMQWLTSKF